MKKDNITTNNYEGIVQNLPEIRAANSHKENENGTSEKKTTRIGSCDYNRWDKYDAGQQ